MINNSKKTEIKVGIITIISITIFIVGLVLVQNIGVGTEMKVIHFDFPNSGGIKVSDPIVVNGVERGIVTKIASKNGSVIITGEVSDLSDIHSDAYAQISILEITGGKKIEISPGKKTDNLSPEDTIKGLYVVGIPELLSDASSIARDLKMLINRLDTTAASLNLLLGDKEFIGDIRTTVVASKEAMTTINKLLQNNKSDLVSTIKNIKYASQTLKELVQRSEPKADSLLDNLDKVISSTDNLIGRSGNITDNVNLLIKNFNDIATEIKEGNSVVNTMLYDKKFNDEFRKSFDNLGKFVDMIKKYGVNVNVRIGTKP
jgi:phospholipid/cholesterol/gamma-HCH transport system substrate-binding protein